MWQRMSFCDVYMANPVSNATGSQKRKFSPRMGMDQSADPAADSL